MGTVDWSFAWDLAWGHVASQALPLFAWSMAAAHVSRSSKGLIRIAGRVGLTAALLWLVIATEGLLNDREALAWYGARVTVIELSLVWGTCAAGVLGGIAGLVGWRLVPAVLTLFAFWYVNAQACTIHGFDMAAQCGVPFVRWQSEGFASAPRTFLGGLAADVAVAITAAAIVQAVTIWFAGRDSRSDKPLQPQVALRHWNDSGIGKPLAAEQQGVGPTRFRQDECRNGATRMSEVEAMAGDYKGEGRWHDSAGKSGTYQVIQTIHVLPAGLEISFRHDFDDGTATEARLTLSEVAPRIYRVAMVETPVGYGSWLEGTLHYHLEVGGKFVEGPQQANEP